MTGRAPSAPPALDGFRFLELLGSGGFSDVFKYEQVQLHRAVAVKVLIGDLDAGGQASFEAEANLMAQMSNHPSIVSIYQAGASPDGRPFLVMEYCPPPGLDKRMRRKPLSVPNALEVGIQVAGAVETAHRLDILHRDIKPANILFTEFNRPALTDFGISVSANAAASGQALGVSVPWAPPEQLTVGQPMGRSGDVYSLAATIWSMLAGHSPFQQAGGDNSLWALSNRVKRDPVPPIGRDDVGPALERVLRTAMAKDPAGRYPTALEFARALQTVQTELHLSVTPIDIRDEHYSESQVEEEDDGGTRISGFVLIDPEGTSPRTGRSTAPAVSIGNDLLTGPDQLNWRRDADGPGVSGDMPAGPVLQHGRGVAEAAERDFTAPAAGLAAPILPAAPGAVEDTRGPAEQRAPRSVSVRALVGAAAAVLVIAVAAFAVAHWTRSPATTARHTAQVSQQPADAIGPAAPSAPVRKQVIAERSSVVFSWRNVDEQAGDSYLWRVDNPAKPTTSYQSTAKTTVSVPVQKGQTCIEVEVRRLSGAVSTPLTMCGAGS
ncbi:serine/threonine-protein kinase [Flexivirga caeni]|uniref:non-specific serine/threonine protein kinase n=1 Tax=Flexivirga caeni TaxID=2294115 RepID=A0A3M9M9P5_9MICO|nr:serine/threonine-protein kinase [Flexivirga caeni]RNI22279.1 serine/threonine protein kinase [Flexivirga caeni]